MCFECNVYAMYYTINSEKMEILLNGYINLHEQILIHLSLADFVALPLCESIE